MKSVAKAVKVKVAKRQTTEARSVPELAASRPAGRGDAPQRERQRNPWKIIALLLAVVLMMTLGYEIGLTGRLDFWNASLRFDLKDAVTGNPAWGVVVSVYGSTNQLAGRCISTDGSCRIDVTRGYYHATAVSSNYSLTTLDVNPQFTLYPLVLTPTFNTVIQPGSMVLACTNVFFTDSVTTFSRNCQTGAIAASGTNASTVIQSMINAVPTVSPTWGHMSATFLFSGVFVLNSAIDVTHSHGLVFTGTSTEFDGGNPLATTNGNSVLIFHHNSIGFDLTGSQAIEFDHLTFGNATGYTPKAFILLARDSSGGSFDRHTFTDDYFVGNASVAMVYNYGSETNHFTRVRFWTMNQAMIVTAVNSFGVASPFRAISTGAVSMNEQYISGSTFDRVQWSSSKVPLITLDETQEVHFTDTFFSIPNGYAINVTDANRNTPLGRVITFDNVHLETGALITASNPSPANNLYAVSIENSFFANTSLPPSGIMFDFSASGLTNIGLTISGNNFIGSPIIQFHVVEDFYIRLDRNLQPFLTITGQSQNGYIDVYNGLYVSNPSRLGVTMVFGKSGAYNFNYGSRGLVSNTTYTFSPGLIAAPTLVFLSSNTTACGALKWGTSGSNLVIGAATSCTATIYWEAWAYPPTG